MPRFDANLSTLFQEFPLSERFGAARRNGFEAVEILFPYETPAGDLAGLLKQNQLECVLLNAPPGRWEAGERGIACLPGRRKEFMASISTGLQYCDALGARRLHVLAGLLNADHDRDACRDIYIENLRMASRRAASQGVDILIEPINPRDFPGYFLNTQADAAAIQDAVGEPNLKMQMDLYHMQIVEGDLEMKLRRYIDRCGHIQIAGPPKRQEPDRGEVNFPYLFGVLDELEYEGWVGCEYRPAAGTEEGLGWLRGLKRDRS